MMRIALAAVPVVAGGNADAVWLSAELAIEKTEESARVRVTELAIADAGWKVPPRSPRAPVVAAQLATP